MWFHFHIFFKIHPKEGEGGGVELGATTDSAVSNKLPQSVLDNLNVPQGKDENKQHLEDLGGVQGLIEKLGLTIDEGLSQEQVLIQREKYGTNEFPESPMDSFLSLLFEACMDTTLLILLGAATVSLIIGFIEDPAGGWIEGAAIYIAVVLVANIGAGNDYSKQLQFRALEASSAKDERCSVFRDNTIERINPKDLVVGDTIVLQVRFFFILVFCLCVFH